MVTNRPDHRATAAAVVGLLLALCPGSAHAQDASSWTSGPATAMPPNQRGETRLLRPDSQRAPADRPGATAPNPRALPGPAAAAPSAGTLQRFNAPGAAPAAGTGAFGSTTVPKTSGGSDPAYDAFDQGRYLTAFELAKTAAATGDPQAHTLVGRLYQEGLGVPRDLIVAAQWYRRAAELGDTEGIFAFGVMLAEGDGLQRNRAGAADLFEQAAARGHVLANYNLALLFLRGDGKAESPQRGALHLRYAAERGVAQAQYDLATLYATGIGVTADAAEAAGWMERAADQGHVDALLEFGVWLFQGRGVSTSQSRGAQMFRQAAEKGSAVAQNRLARCYAYGAGFPADLDEAAKWHVIARSGGVEDVALDELIKALPIARRQTALRVATEWMDRATLQ